MSFLFILAVDVHNVELLFALCIASTTLHSSFITPSYFIFPTPSLELTMKLYIAIALLSSVSAFAPAPAARDASTVSFSYYLSEHLSR
jgi:hypothetical protein